MGVQPEEPSSGPVFCVVSDRLLLMFPSRLRRVLCFLLSRLLLYLWSLTVHFCSCVAVVSCRLRGSCPKTEAVKLVKSTHRPTTDG